MERIKCTIDHITYQNQENGYAVLQAIVKGFRDKQTLVGTFHEVKVGAVLTVDGDWRVDKRYGRQFAAQSWSEELPATIVGIEKYLGSGLVKGIGPGTGKTTTLGIIAALESIGQRILLAAPTGRAAKRMSEATGKEAIPSTGCLNTIPLKAMAEMTRTHWKEECSSSMNHR